MVKPVIKKGEIWMLFSGEVVQVLDPCFPEYDMYSVRLSGTSFRSDIGESWFDYKIGG